jgi:2-polyprenyl-6-methoxyphenol hydroxylase-like FAD-dependent oxidoreductase
MQAEVTDLIEVNGIVAGVRARTPNGVLEIRAPLTVGADGRHSVVRERAGLEVIDLGAPMDVMWMRISRHTTDPAQTLGHFDRGRILFLINREDYWQCAFVIPKGTADEIRQRGLKAFHRYGKRSSGGPRTEEFPDSRHATAPDPDSEQCDPPNSGQRRDSLGSVASEGPAALANSAAHSGSGHRPRFSS